MAQNSEERVVEIIVNGQKANASMKEMTAAAAVLSSQVNKIAADDPKRAELIAQLQEMRQRLAATRQEVAGLTQSEEQLAAAAAEVAEKNQQAIATGKGAAASYSEMKTAAGLLETQLHQLSADDPGRAAMIADYQALKARMGEARQEIEQVTKSEAQLRAEEEALRQSQQELIVNGKKVSASLREMKEAGALLEKELENMAHTDPGFAAKAKEVREMRERISEVSEAAKGAEKSMFGWKDAFALGGVTVGLEEAVDLVKEMGAAVAETTKEFLDLRSNINTLTGADGAELDKLTAQVAGIARTFGKENDEVLQAANTLSKHMGVSQQEALRLIQQGFLAGADASGEFLDQVKEYPAQFKAAGMSADQAIGLISQSVTTGVFSDKGADVIKEFGIKIREQTVATSDAMQAAFGEPFTKKIFDGINNGTLTTAQALQMVAKEMDETQIPANRLQTVVADVFGGPGEDAGIDYLKSLKNVGKGIDEMVDHTNEFTLRQEALLASELELAGAQNNLAKEFESTGTSMSTIGNEAKVLGYTLLASLVVTFKELFQPLRDIWDSFMNLTSQMKIFGGEGITVRGVAEAIGGAFRLVLTPTRLLLQALGWLVTGMYDWAASSPKVIAALKFMTAPMQLFLDMLLHAPAYMNGFKAEAMATFSSIGRIIKAGLSGDLASVKAEFSALGQGAGNAFQSAYQATLEFDELWRNGVSFKKENSSGGEDKKPDAGGDGSTSKTRAQAEKERAAQAKKDQADQERADKEAEERKRRHQEMLINEEQTAYITTHKLRENELAKIKFDAMRAALAVKGTEQEKHAAIALIYANAQLAKQAKQDEYDKQDAEAAKKAAEEKAKLQEEFIGQQIDTIDDDEARKQAAYDVMHEAGLLSQQAYDDAKYEARRAALERELALIESTLGKESNQYKRVRSELLKNETEHSTKSIANTKQMETTKQQAQQAGLQAASGILGATLDLLFKDEAARKKHHNMYTALAGAKIIMDGIAEVQAIWLTANSNWLNTLVPGWGPVFAGVQTGFAVARTGMALANLQEFSFAQGGATGGGMTMAGAKDSGRKGMSVSPIGQLLDLSGVIVGANGKLMDNSGFAVAGLVHEDEYVVPKWMRQDPQVAAVEQWLEAKRLRGYAEGGGTGGATLPAASAALTSDGELTYAVLVQLLEQAKAQTAQLANVENWQTRFQVVFDMQQHQQLTEERKQVQLENGIRV